MAIAAEKSAAEGRWVQFSEIPETVVCTDPLNCQIDFARADAEVEGSEDAEGSEVRKLGSWKPPPFAWTRPIARIGDL